MQHDEMQETQPRFTTRPPAAANCRRSMFLAGGIVAAVLLLGTGGIFGWQQLSANSARTVIAPTAAAPSSPSLPGPLNGVNPLPCGGAGKAPIKLKGHALPLCPPGEQGGVAPASTPSSARTTR